MTGREREWERKRERVREGERVSEKVRERGERVCEKVRERLCVGENEMRISLFMDLSLNQVFLQATIFKSKISHRKVIQARTLKKKVNYHFSRLCKFPKLQGNIKNGIVPIQSQKVVS